MAPIFALPPLWADHEAAAVSGGDTNYLILLMAALGPFLAVVLPIVFARLKQKRADTIAEWKEYADRLEKRADLQEAEAKTWQKNVWELSQKMSECEKDRGGQKVEITKLQAELTTTTRRLVAIESKTGLATPSNLSGIILADPRGIIREFSPALSVFLGWEPKEMRGRALADLFPDCADCVPGRVEDIDPSRPVLAYAAAKPKKEGDPPPRVPVSILYRGWEGEDKALITMTITERAVAEQPS